MVNAGAIAVSALLHAEHGDEAFSMVLMGLGGGSQEGAGGPRGGGS
jgi:glutaminase